jgi:NIPSNAP protein
VEYQYRRYRIADGAMAEFLAEWREQIVPLRRRFGFEVVGAWVAEEENTFVWILCYAGAEGYAARDAEYYGSDERKELDPDPARHLAEVETTIVVPVTT